MKSALENAEAALQRGDYGLCLQTLSPLAKTNPLPGQKGSKIRMLMVTALMGQGNEEQAKTICRQITQSEDPELRQLSKQLLLVLDAPSLQRPSEWSIKLPTIRMDDISKNSFSTPRNKPLKKSKENLPPTGPTKGLDLGFAGIVITILIFLTLLLSGCVQVKTEFNLISPNKINLNIQTKSNSHKTLPWQLNLEESAKHLSPKLNITTNNEGFQKIGADNLQLKEASFLIKELSKAASNSGGFEITDTEIKTDQRNWVIGIEQDLNLNIDLTKLPEIPGLKLLVAIDPPNFISSVESNPHTSKRVNGDFLWKLEQGEVNNLHIHSWSWSLLGIGSLLIVALFSLSLVLQKIKLKMGFGFPELPP